MSGSLFFRSVFWILAALLVARPEAVLAADAKTLPIGAAAPEFSLPGVDGKTYSLSDFADADVLAIIFTCNHCPTAQAYEERIKQLAADYKDRGVAVVAISPNDAAAVRLDELGYSDLGDSLDDMKIRARDHKFNFPYLYDGETQATSRAYGPVATPHVFLFDRDRKLRFCGRIDDHENPAKTKTHDTRNALEALLSDNPVAVATTRTFGCSVKWADKKQSAAEALAKWDREPAELKHDRRGRVGRAGRQQVGQASRDQHLGDALRALHDGVSGAGGDSSHVSQPRLRAGDRLGRRPGEPRSRAEVSEQAACVDHELHFRQGRPVRAGRRAGRRVAGGVAIHARGEAGRRSRVLENGSDRSARIAAGNR